MIPPAFQFQWSTDFIFKGIHSRDYRVLCPLVGFQDNSAFLPRNNLSAQKIIGYAYLTVKAKQDKQDLKIRREKKCG